MDFDAKMVLPDNEYVNLINQVPGVAWREKSSETPNAHTHFPDEPKITALQLNICLDFVDRTFGDNKKRF